VGHLRGILRGSFHLRFPFLSSSVLQLGVHLQSSVLELPYCLTLSLLLGSGLRPSIHPSWGYGYHTDPYYSIPHLNWFRSCSCSALYRSFFFNYFCYFLLCSYGRLINFSGMLVSFFFKLIGKNREIPGDHEGCYT